MTGVMVLAGVVAGFYAGRVYQTAVATWTDHAAQRVKERKLRRARWAAWRAVTWPALGVLAVVAVIIAGR